MTDVTVIFEETNLDEPPTLDTGVSEIYSICSNIHVHNYTCIIKQICKTM